MKKIIWVITLALLVAGCTKEYEFNTQFTTPKTLHSPASVVINVTSTENIKFTWSGGGAEQGYTTYEVLFDKVGGDFSNPIYRSYSDLGVDTTLTLTHALLNTIARKSGISTSNTGKLIWTVTASKGGEVKKSNLSKEITVTRGAGIDYNGKTLFLYGTAAENNGTGGIAMRNAAEGIFVIYTKFPVNGNIFFKSSATDPNAFVCYSDASNKIQEGSGTYNVTANTTGEISRVTVNLNTQKMTIDKVGAVKAIWGATFNVIGNMVYQGNGMYQADNCTIKFIQQDRPDTNPPSWLGWVEERYYFTANVNGTDVCWGRRDGVSAERPTGNETSAFYELNETSWSQWDHLWKMKGSLDLKKCTITINTNDNGMVTHSFSNVQPL